MNSIIGAVSLAAGSAEELAVAHATFAALVGELQQPSYHVWLDNERLAQGGLLLDDEVGADEAARLSERWMQGRIFTLAVDLRWEWLKRPRPRLHLVLIADKELPRLFEQDAQLELRPREQASTMLLLWGRREEGESGQWRETRIPALHGSYPPHWRGPYAALKVRSYLADWPKQRREELAGARVVTRYLGFDGNYSLQPDTR
jgi:hypothetical protein